MQHYAESRSESAFTELVRRHVDLVYSAALRMARDAHQAKDVTQGVFVALAQNARQLTSHPVLSGWLHRTAQNLAANVIRANVRRQAREQEAVAMNELLVAAPETSWEHIAPHLDDALGELSEPDRDAVMLRYFEKKSAQEMASLLGVSDEAAQKRVSRAVEKLREFFSKQKITIGASGLVVLISANAVQSAPIGLAVTISAAAFAGTAVTTSTIIAATTKTIAMTTLQKTVITAAFVAAAGAGIFEARQAANARAEVQTFQQQQAPLTAQIQNLQREHDDATNHLAELRDELANANKNNLELMKLRANATRYQTATKVENDPAFEKATEWLAKESKLREQFELHPEQWIPEIKFLSSEEWLDEARMADLNTANGMRCALSNVRSKAVWKFAQKISQALQSYLITHNQQLPDSTSQLSLYFHPPVEDAEKILSRYEMLSSDEQKNPTYQGAVIIQNQKTLVDHIDNAVLIGTKKITTTAPRLNFPTVIPNELMPVVNAYQDAIHEGFLTIYDLEPYATTPEQKKALNKFMKAATISQ